MVDERQEEELPCIKRKANEYNCAELKEDQVGYFPVLNEKKIPLSDSVEFDQNYQKTDC